MELSVCWVCLLCLQAALLAGANANDANDANANDANARSHCPGHDCVSQRDAAGLNDDITQLRRTRGTDGEQRRTVQKRRPGGGSAIGSIRNTLEKTEEKTQDRQRRQAGGSGPAHLRPGAISVRGFPNTLIQAERARRHLAHPSSNVRKKNKIPRKSRVGSFSLLKHDHTNPLQVTRVRRQMESDLRKGKSGRSGAYSVLGDPATDGPEERPKRSPRRKMAAQRTCSE